MTVFEHMPFLVSENILLLCEAGDLNDVTLTVKNEMADEIVSSIPLKYRCWKMKKKDLTTGIETPINSGLPSYAIECSPSAYLDGDTWKISFIGELTSLDFNSKTTLYQIQTKDWITFSEPIKINTHPTRWGFENSKIVVLVGKDRNIIVTTKTEDIVYYLKINFDIYSVRYLSEDHMCLTVTGKTQNNIFKTLLINLNSYEVKEMKDSNGESIYKSTKYGNLLIHAKKIGIKFEQRQLVFDSPTLVDSDISVSIDKIIM